ncbi:Ig-like domain-containing protein [Chloroflexota bacterium]
MATNYSRINAMCNSLWWLCFVQQPTVISSLKAGKDWVTPSGSSKVECAASDPDGDSLTYHWSATGGTIYGGGSSVTWVAPDVTGTYTITVTVKDKRGAEALRQLTLDVRSNNPPVIESLTAEPPEVVQAGTGTIKCTASDLDGDELSYEWAATRGSISGQGSSIVWTAPGSCGSTVITVTVADTRGGEASKELKIKVITPS